MVPLRDNIPSRRFPLVTPGIIFVNMLVFLHELSLGHRLGTFLDAHAIIPARYTESEKVHSRLIRTNLLSTVEKDDVILRRLVFDRW